ncbi:MAG: hypothetical protein WBE73_18230, partial [Candidatus Acidiferrum sp.]
RKNGGEQQSEQNPTEGQSPTLFGIETTHAAATAISEDNLIHRSATRFPVKDCGQLKSRIRAQ